MLTFLSELDEDIRKIVMAQLRNLWTHTSTAIEGNTLTLGETAFVIEEGLTISGKPLKDHQEVVGHARALNLIYDLIDRKTGITEQDLYDLHRAVQTHVLFDVYHPVGKWKVAPNYTSMISGDQQIIFEYADPLDVPMLMQKWLDDLNGRMNETLSQDAALKAYAMLHIAFVRIHPFSDGNGRIARLISNLPVLKSGFPPVIILKERRHEYIMTLTEYHLSAKTPKPDAPLVPETEALKKFIDFCSDSWKASVELVDTAKKKQAERKRKYTM